MQISVTIIIIICAAYKPLYSQRKHCAGPLALW